MDDRIGADSLRRTGRRRGSGCDHELISLTDCSAVDQCSTATEQFAVFSREDMDGSDRKGNDMERADKSSKASVEITIEQASDSEDDGESRRSIEAKSGSPTLISHDLPSSPPQLPLTEATSPPPLFSPKSARLRIGLMLMLGLYSVVSMRLNLSMGIVCMVNSTAFPSTAKSVLQEQIGEESRNHPQCERRTEEMASHGYNGSLLWAPQIQSMLLSATFYGSLGTITVAGVFADKFGPKNILGGAALVYIVVTLATPFLAEYSFLAYFLARLVMGLAEGFVFPCLGSMAGRWFPPNERSTLAAIYTSGNQLAASLSSLISAGLCSSPLGWPAIFYLFGSIGLIWLLGWCVLVTNVPEKNRFISAREKIYLKEVIQQRKKSHRVPWRAMLRSPPIYACFCAQFAFNFTTTIMMSLLPMYFRDELLLSLGQNGLYTTVPFVTQFVTKLLISILADKLKQKKVLKPTTCSILFQTINSAGTAICLFCLAIFPSCEKPWLAVIFLAFCGAFFSATVPGFLTSMLSIAPLHSGTVTSIGRTAACIANALAPMWLSLIMLMKTRYTWRVVFITSGILNVIAGLIFYFYGNAEIQEWAIEEEKSEKAQSAVSPPSSVVHPVEKADEEK